MKQTRQAKALDKVKNMEVEQKTPFKFIVNGTSKKSYGVITWGENHLTNEGREYWACECIDYKVRCRKAKIDCKHIMAAKVFRTLHKL
jgi:predicted nucleic acid-binding Zn finger protein